MPVNNQSAWAISGAIAGLALIIYSPLLYYMVEMLFMSKGWISSDQGKKPTVLGLIVHTVVLFFLTYVIVSQIDWT